MAKTPYQVPPNVASVKRITLTPVVGLAGVLLLCGGVLICYRGKANGAHTGEDLFAASRNKPALESADIILAGAPTGGIPLEMESVPTTYPSLPSKKEPFPWSDEVRGQRVKDAKDSDLDKRSLTSSSVVSIPHAGAIRARKNSPLSDDSERSLVTATTTAATTGFDPRLMDGLSQSGEVDPNKQEEKRAFLNSTGDESFVLAHAVIPKRERELKTGSLIPAILMTGLNSDLPGSITAQVTSHVYDTATGDTIIIPQGSRLFGKYDSEVTYGQSSVLAAWNRLIFPDGRSLDLDVMPGADAAGRGGFSDEVDRHYGRIFGSSLLMSLMGAGVQLSQPQSRGGLGNNLSAQQLIAANVGVHMGQTGVEVTRKNLNVQPTIKIRPGYRFMVIVNKDFTVP